VTTESTVTTLHWITLSTRRRHAGENDLRHVWIRDYAEDTIAMSNRARDWFEQALKDLEAAEHLRRVGRHEWACFAAHQSSEKAVKSLHHSHSKGAPFQHYGPIQSEQALQYAREVIDFVRSSD
jgi:HEPN domain-containing protein